MTYDLILYKNLNELPKFDSNGNLINKTEQFAIDGVAQLFDEAISGNKVLKLFLNPDTISEAITITLKFIRSEDGTITDIEVFNGENLLGKIGNNFLDSLPSLVGTAAITEALISSMTKVIVAAALPALAEGVLGIIGTVAVAGAVSIAYSYLEGLTTPILADWAANAWGVSTKVDMQFTDANGEHNSGLFFKDGMGDLSDKAAIAYFLENSGENTHGGTFNFSKSGLDRSYDVYDASIYQSVAEKLGIELEEFLAAGYNGKTNFDGFIGGAAYSAIFSKNSPSLIYIPVKVNGVTEVFLVNGIYIGDIKSDAISMGRNIEAVLGNSLILDGKDGSLVIRQHSSDPLVEDNYIIVGDAGSNNINTEDGNDTIVAGVGDDKITAGYGRNVIDGGEGVDTLDYSFLSLGSRDLVVNLENHTATNGISLNRVNDAIYNM